jgi:hypothetical protein
MFEDCSYQTIFKRTLLIHTTLVGFTPTKGYNFINFLFFRGCKSINLRIITQPCNNLFFMYLHKYRMKGEKNCLKLKNCLFWLWAT